MKLNNKLQNIVVSSEEPIIKNDVWIQISKNLFDNINNYFNVSKTLDTQGNLIGPTTRSVIFKFPVQPSTKYALSSSNINIGNIYFYDDSGNFISSLTSEWAKQKKFTSVSNAYYISFAVKTDSETAPTIDELKIQLEYNDVTSYEPYTAPSIKVNNNGVYETVYKNHQFIDNAGYHNSIFRGKDITSYLDDETLYTRISSGSFDDLFVGDYIIKNNITWRIAGFDVYLHKGSAELTNHHAVIVPDKNLITAYMNDTNTTVGGYVSSKMFTETLPSVLENYITPVFGSHVITYKNLLTNGINSTGYNRFGTNTGCSNSWAWQSRQLDLMNENQLFGSATWSSSGYETGSDNCQLPLFRLAPEYITNRSCWCWLRNVIDASRFALIDARGSSDNSCYASSVGGVRPYFYID